MYLFLTTKNSLFISNIHYLWNGIDFESVILFKVCKFLQEIRCLKNYKDELLRIESDLAILNYLLKISCSAAMQMNCFRFVNVNWMLKTYPGNDACVYSNLSPKFTGLLCFSNDQSPCWLFLYIKDFEDKWRFYMYIDRENIDVCI